VLAMHTKALAASGENGDGWLVSWGFNGTVNTI